MGIPQIINAVKNPDELLSLFLPDPVLIGDVEVDVLNLEVKELRYEVTKRKVESGFSMATARRKIPVAIRIEGWLTDAPLDPVSIGTSLISGQGFSFVTWKDKKDRLEEVADSDELIDISARLDVYTDVSITFLRVEQNKDTSGGYPFVLEAENLRIFSSAITDVDPSQIPKNLRDKEQEKHKKAAGKKKPPSNEGQKASEEATKKDQDPLRSLAQGLGFDV